MNKLIVLGTNSYQLPLILKAKSMGFEVHLFGIGTGTPQQVKMATIACPYADHYYPISIYNKEEILELAKTIKPVGIVSIGADNATQTISYISTRMGWTCNTEECALVSTNKYEMKKRFKRHGIPTTDFIYTDKPEDLPFPYPVMVKAIDRAGKIGIVKVERPEDLAECIKFGLAGNWEADKVLVEQYAPGKEFSAESISWNGQHTVLNFTEKWSSPPNYVEEMHLQPATFSHFSREKMTAIVEAALTALDIRYGPSHTEFKVDDEGNVNIIEIAARMAAENMCYVTQIATGVDYIKATIDIALGQAPDLSTLDRARASAVKYLITEADFERWDWLKRNRLDQVYFTSPVIEPFDNRKMLRNADRYGFYIVNCSSREEVLELTGAKSCSDR